MAKKSSLAREFSWVVDLEDILHLNKMREI
jgi:hypothetical protein